eukprot:scaffold148242_cov33-Prasinocladus_malaysianus.AAC.2
MGPMAAWLLSSVYKAAIAMTSTRMDGRAIGDATHARAGLLFGSTQAFQTSFMGAKCSSMSLTHTWALSILPLEVPASASSLSTFASTCSVWAVMSEVSR